MYQNPMSLLHEMILLTPAMFPHNTPKTRRIEKIGLNNVYLFSPEELDDLVNFLQIAGFRQLTNSKNRRTGNLFGRLHVLRFHRGRKDAAAIPFEPVDLLDQLKLGSALDNPIDEVCYSYSAHLLIRSLNS